MQPTAQAIGRLAQAHQDDMCCMSNGIPRKQSVDLLIQGRFRPICCLYMFVYQFTSIYKILQVKYIMYLSCTCSSCNYSLHLAPLGRHVQIVALFWITIPVEQEHPAPAEGKHSENPPWVSGYLAPNERPQQHPHRVAVQNPRSLSSVCSTYRHHDIFMLQHAPQIPKH